MKFLVDAQLPERLTAALQRHGHDALHVAGFEEHRCVELSRTHVTLR